MFYRNLPPPSKQQKLSTTDDNNSTNNTEIPHILQGEIARLDQKFKISLDPSSQSGTKVIKLVGFLDDKHLPCVPPISIVIPGIDSKLLVYYTPKPTMYK